MQTSSRRAVIATALAGLAAGCAPVALASTSADADLIRLGEEFDRAEREWIPLWREWQRHERLWRDTIQARGMSFAAHGHDAVMAVFIDAGGDVASEANNAALDRLDTIRDRIKKIKPMTLAGLAVWAKVARFDGTSIHVREKPADQRDTCDAAILDFLTLVEEMAGQAVQS